MLPPLLPPPLPSPLLGQGWAAFTSCRPAAYTPAPALAAAGGELTVSDLIAGLGDGKGKLGAARKALERLEKKAAPVAAPLPGPIQQRQERKAGWVARGLLRLLPCWPRSAAALVPCCRAAAA